MTYNQPRKQRSGINCLWVLQTGKRQERNYKLLLVFVCLFACFSLLWLLLLLITIIRGKSNIVIIILVVALIVLVVVFIYYIVLIVRFVLKSWNHTMILRLKREVISFYLYDSTLCSLCAVLRRDIF